MKTIYTFIALAIATASVSGQAPGWAWARGAGGNSINQGKSIATDAAGNVYVAGSFQDSTITFGSTTFNSAGASDVYLVKYSPAGNVIWAKTAGGMSYDDGLGVTTDAAGNIYFTGNFAGSITFGGTTLLGTTAQTVFLVKYDAQGNVLWAVSSSGDLAKGTHVAVGPDGSPVLCGYMFTGTVSFDNVTVMGGHADNVFLVKFNASGDAQWGQAMGSNDYDEIGGIDIDGQNNIYISGHFLGSSLLISFTLNVVPTPTTTNSSKLFTAKFNPSGVPQWAKGIYPGFSNSGCGLARIAVDQSGNSYVTAIFSGATLVGTTQLNSTSQQNPVFIVKYDPQGNVAWARASGVTNNSPDYVTGIMVNAKSEVYVAGTFSSSSFSFGNHSFSGEPPSLFIAKCDTAGNAVWTKSSEISLVSTSLSALAVDTHNNVYVTGYFTGQITIGSTVLTANSPVGNLFVARLGTFGNTAMEEDPLPGIVSVYPNPATDETRINTLFGRGTCRVFDRTGRVVLERDFDSADFTLDLKTLNTGLYLISISSEGKTATSKIVTR